MRRVGAVLSKDYFDLLGIPRRYQVDIAELERRYLERSKEVHPDRFATAEAARRVQALQESMELNRAYNTLKKPVPRAEYLLAAQGVDIGDNEQLDPGFLMHVLEAREELAEARAAGDAARLSRLRDEMERERAAAQERVADQFAAWEGDGDGAHLQAIKRELILLRYVRRYLEQFDDDED